MTEFRVEVVRIGAVRKHENADSLSLTDVHGGYPVIFRSGDCVEGQLATYIPVDAIVPDVPEWAFLKGHLRIRAKKLRGVFSMGMLTAAPPGASEGDDVREALGITKWEPEAEHIQNVRGRCEDDELTGPTETIPKYDLEGLRRYMGAIEPGEEVILTEKIHGENARLYHDGARLWIGSRTRWKLADAECGWSRYARDNDLAERLSAYSGLCFYGELYGNTDLKYGANNQKRGLRIFDVFDVNAGRFVDARDFVTRAWPFDRVPMLYRGPWSTDLLELAEGSSTLGEHVREGFVVKPITERVGHHGRTAFKFVGRGYLTRKAA